MKFNLDIRINKVCYENNKDLNTKNETENLNIVS